MKARIGHRTVEIGVRGGVGGGAIERDSPGNRNSRELVANPTPSPFTFTLNGILPGGKNAVKITRTGHRYPDQRFVLWRENALSQLPATCPRFTGPITLVVDYVPGDKRRRDLPGMTDALLHLLEKAKLVKDDAQVKGMVWTPFPLDREHPSCRVTILEWEEGT